MNNKKRFLYLIIIMISLIVIANSLMGQTDTVSQYEKNKKLIMRLFDEGFNQRNLNIIDELIVPDYIEHINGVSARGSIAIIKTIKWLEETAPDFVLKVEEIIAEKDKVVLQWRFEGTNVVFGKKVVLNGIYIGRIEENKIVEGWQIFDNYQRFLQLGYTFEAPADSLQ
jgi:C-1 hydroxylase